MREPLLSYEEYQARVRAQGALDRARFVGDEETAGAVTGAVTEHRLAAMAESAVLQEAFAAEAVVRMREVSRPALEACEEVVRGLSAAFDVLRQDLLRIEAVIEAAMPRTYRHSYPRGGKGEWWNERSRERGRR